MRNESSLVLADGRAVEGQSTGGLEEWKDKLIEIKQLLRATGRADLDRCRAVRQDLPELSTLPRVDRCFKLIGEGRLLGVLLLFLMRNSPYALH